MKLNRVGKFFIDFLVFLAQIFTKSKKKEVGESKELPHVLDGKGGRRGGSSNKRLFNMMGGYSPKKPHLKLLLNGFTGLFTMKASKRQARDRKESDEKKYRGPPGPAYGDL